MKGYKVVHYCLTPTYMSCLVHDKRHGVEYWPGKPARPHEGCGPLAVFLDLQAAVRFMGRDRFYYLWECEYTPYSKDLPVIDGRTVACWGNFNDPYERLYVGELPPGTALASEVTLTKKLLVEWGYIRFDRCHQILPDIVVGGDVRKHRDNDGGFYYPCVTVGDTTIVYPR